MSAPQLPEVRSQVRKIADKVQTHERRINRLDRKISPIKAGQIGGVEIADGSITGEKIIADSIHSTHISAGAISAGHIAAWTINAGHISALSINTGHIQAGAVTATEILAGAINADHISAGAIEAGHLSANSVTADAIMAGTISSALIAAGAIEAGHIKAGAIQTGHIQAGAVTAGAIAAGAVTATSIAANTITGSHLAVQVTLSGMIRTGPTGARVEMDPNGLRGYDATEDEKFRFDTATGSLTLDGIITAQAGSAVPITYITSGNVVSGTVITIDSGGYLQTSPDANNQVRLDSSGLKAYSGGVLKASIQAATSSFTGATFQTATPGTASRVVLDGSGFRAYASDGVTERINISGGTSTITGGVIQTAASPAARIAMSGSSNSLGIFGGGGSEIIRLDPTSGAGFLVGSSLNLDNERLAQWRTDVPSGAVVAGVGGIRYADGSGVWNWGMLQSQYAGTENAGAVLRAGDLDQPSAQVVCWNQPSLGGNRRRVDLSVRRDDDTATYTATLNGSDGTMAFPRQVRVYGNPTGDWTPSFYVAQASGARVEYVELHANYTWCGDNMEAGHITAKGRLSSDWSGFGNQQCHIINRHGGFNSALIETLADAIGLNSQYNHLVCRVTGGTVAAGIAGHGVISHRGLNSLSDATLKENIRDLSASRTKVRALRPRTFSWRDSDAPETAGFVAQEVAVVIPEIATAFEGVAGYDLGGLVAHTVAAVQEQDTELEFLRTNQQTLLAAVERLEARIVVLENRPGPPAKL